MSGWTEEQDAHVLHGFFGNTRARVNWTGTFWRCTTWTKKGTSSVVENYLADAKAWCDEWLRYGA